MDEKRKGKDGLHLPQWSAHSRPQGSKTKPTVFVLSGSESERKSELTSFSYTSRNIDRCWDGASLAGSVWEWTALDGKCLPRQILMVKAMLTSLPILCNGMLCG